MDLDAKASRSTYTYDDAGNILTKAEYAYTTGTVSSATASHTYTYGNSNWGDLLTKYDDIRVYHDEIGNLVRYSTNTYIWEHGRQLASMGVGSDFAILEQPENSVGALGDDICFSVVARGNGLSYLWQISNDNGASWSTSTAQGYNTPSISGFEMNATRNGRLYRCKITDSNGNVLYSKPAEVVLVDIHISAQPQDFYGDIGDTCAFSVDASGDGLIYEWQVSTNGGSYFYASGAEGCTTNAITVEMTSARVGYFYRCKITDASGNVVYSEPGEIRNDALAIVRQPEDFVGIVGSTVRFTIEAYGEGLTYQWQVSTDGGGYWGSSTAGGYNTASMSVPLTEKRIGYLYRCKVTDANGNVVYSEPGEIQVGHVRWDFTYDANGMRTSRTSGVTTYDYIYNGSQLTQMTVRSHTLNFVYDVDGKPAYVVYDGTKYFYLTNLQGDVVAIADKNGNILVEYTYDAWGNILTTTGSMATTLGKYNPLRYRGYVYDQESALYYLQSRYYDPALGRFINADAYTSTGQGVLGNNMFAYCQNNPIIYLDSSGNRIVGFGVQGEVSIGGVSTGVEVVIYFDAEVCKDADFLIVLYTYSGYELSLSQIDQIMALVDIAALSSCIDSSYSTYGGDDFLSYFLNSSMAQILRGIFTDGGSATVAAFVIDGYDNFDDPSDYSGRFDTASCSSTFGTHTSGMFIAVSETCRSLGAKYGRSYSAKKMLSLCPISYDISWSVTYYSSPVIAFEGYI